MDLAPAIIWVICNIQHFLHPGLADSSSEEEEEEEEEEDEGEEEAGVGDEEEEEENSDSTGEYTANNSVAFQYSGHS